MPLVKPATLISVCCSCMACCKINLPCMSYTVIVSPWLFTEIFSTIIFSLAGLGYSIKLGVDLFSEMPVVLQPIKVFSAAMFPLNTFKSTCVVEVIPETVPVQEYCLNVQVDHEPILVGAAVELPSGSAIQSLYVFTELPRYDAIEPLVYNTGSIPVAFLTVVIQVCTQVVSAALVIELVKDGPLLGSSKSSAGINLHEPI